MTPAQYEEARKVTADLIEAKQELALAEALVNEAGIYIMPNIPGLEGVVVPKELEKSFVTLIVDHYQGNVDKLHKKFEAI